MIEVIRVAVTCGREHRVSEREALALFRLLNEPRASYPRPVTIVRHGNARGGDRQIADLVDSWDSAFILTDPVEAAWEPMKKLLGEFDHRWKAAGNIRNWQLLRGASKLYAFPGGRGTADCVRQAEAMGVPVVRIGP